MGEEEKDLLCLFVFYYHPSCHDDFSRIFTIGLGSWKGVWYGSGCVFLGLDNSGVLSKANELLCLLHVVNC